MKCRHKPECTYCSNCRRMVPLYYMSPELTNPSYGIKDGRKCQHCVDPERSTVKLCIKFPNILASMYAQKRITRYYKVDILGGKLIKSDVICIVLPPTACESLDDNPLIVKGGKDNNSVGYTTALSLAGTLLKRRAIQPTMN